MPSLNIRWYRDGAVNVTTFPRYRVEGAVLDTDPLTGLEVAVFDFNGANRLTFPNDVNNYTEDQREQLLDAIANTMVSIASGGLWQRRG